MSSTESSPRAQRTPSREQQPAVSRGSPTLRRKASVTQFLRQGEQNPTFADKAPSIIPGGTAGSSAHAAASDGGGEGGGGGDGAGPVAGRGSDAREPLLGWAKELEFFDMDDDGDERGDDFATVDWVRENDTYLSRNSAMHEDLKRTPCPRLVNAWHSGQAWVLCVVVGLSTGTLAAFIDSAVHWLSDVKVGFCRYDFWRGYSFCCNVDSSIMDPAHPCDDWMNWATLLGAGTGSETAVNYVMYVVSAVLMTTVCAWLVQSFAPYARGSGIPEVKTILGGVVIHRYMGLWTLLIKSIGVVMSIGSGLPLGKEGPFVHLACCVGNVWSRLFSKFRGNMAKKNEIISAAVASGIGVAFGAPIGGVLFSLEEVSTYFPSKTMIRAFFTATVASLTLQYIDPLRTGKVVLFQINYSNPIQWFEYVPFVLLGVVGGLLGVFFIRVNLLVAGIRKSTALGQFKILEASAVTLLSAVVMWNSRLLRPFNLDVLAALYQQCPYNGVGSDPLDLCSFDSTGDTLLSLLFFTLALLLLCVITFGVAVPSGLYVPALLIGAGMGRMVGTVVRFMQHEHPESVLFSSCSDPGSCITPGVYAIVGSAAVMGGITRMTVSLVVIIFEVTGGLEYILPLMVATIVAKWVGDAFGRDGIYEEYIKLNGYPFLEAVEHVDKDTTAEQVMVRDPVVLTMHGHTVASLFEQVALADRMKINGFPVVTSTADMLVVGYISKHELRAGLAHALSGNSRSSSKVELISGSTRCYFGAIEMRFPKNSPYVDMRKWLHPTPLQAVETTKLHRIYNLFKKLGLRYVLITRFGKLVGILTKKDLLTYMEMHEHEIHGIPLDPSRKKAPSLI